MSPTSFDYYLAGFRESMTTAYEDGPRFVNPQPLVPGSIYARPVLEGVLCVGTNTITEWITKGLEPFGQGAKTDLFFSDDVIRFLREMGPKDKSKLRESAKRAAERRNRKKRD